MTTTPVRVLVVDDEDDARCAHAEYVRRVGGCEVVGTAATGNEAARIIRARRTSEPVQLVLLDLDLPDIHGLDLCRQMRASGVEVDVVVVTAARDLAAVRSAVSLGVVQYVIKPFTFATFAEKLRVYLEFRRPFESGTAVVSQEEIDRTLAVLRTPTSPTLAKGLSAQTLTVVADALRAAQAPLSASEVAAAAALSRVTARRYLEHLADTGQVSRDTRYGTPGRPEYEYRLR